MARLLLKLIGISIVICFILTAIIYTTSHDEAYIQQIEITMTSEEMCSGTCLMGITPGQSNSREAYHLLAEHPWVSAAGPMRLEDGMLWSWSGEQPEIIDSAIGGIMSLHNGNYLQIRTTVPIYHIEQALGTPAFSELKGSHRQVFYRIYYPDMGIKVFTTANCPTQMADLLGSPARIVWDDDLEIPQNEATANFQWDTSYCRSTVSA